MLSRCIYAVNPSMQMGSVWNARLFLRPSVTWAAYSFSATMNNQSFGSIGFAHFIQKKKSMIANVPNAKCVCCQVSILPLKMETSMLR